MATHTKSNRISRGLVGAIAGLGVSLAFVLGLSVKACLPNRPELFWLVTFEVFAVGFVINIPAVIVGFAVGYFTRRKVLLVMALGLAAVAFVVGYALAHDGCVPL